MKLKKGDSVKVMMGKDKGKVAPILRITSADKVMLEGINQYKKHVKGRSRDQKSEIVTITKPLPIGNVALICPKCKKTTRVGYEVKNGNKIRVCRKCGGAI